MTVGKKGLPVDLTPDGRGSLQCLRLQGTGNRTAKAMASAEAGVFSKRVCFGGLQAGTCKKGEFLVNFRTARCMPCSAVQIFSRMHGLTEISPCTTIQDPRRSARIVQACASKNRWRSNACFAHLTADDAMSALQSTLPVQRGCRDSVCPRERKLSLPPCTALIVSYTHFPGSTCRSLLNDVLALDACLIVSQRPPSSEARASKRCADGRSVQGAAPRPPCL